MPTISINTKKVPAKARKSTATSYQQALTEAAAAVSPYAATLLQPKAQSLAVSQQQKAIKAQNTTPTTKPADPTIGQSYYNTHLGIPLYWNGLHWTDHSGAKVFTANILGTETTILEASSITIQIPTDQNQQQNQQLTVIMGTIDITQDALDTDTLTVTIPYVTADITISYPST